MKIFLSTHGKMASGLKSSLEILGGDTDIITVFDAHLPGSTETVEEKAEQFFAQCDENETKLLLTDLYGGSVNQSLMKYVDRPNTFLLSGVNLVLLFELALVPQEYTKEELLSVIETAKEGIKIVEIIQHEAEEDFF